MHHWKFGLLADAHGPIILAFPLCASVPYLLDSRIAGRLLVSVKGCFEQFCAERRIPTFGGVGGFLRNCGIEEVA